MPPETVDARGLKCPLPVLKAEKALAGLPSGGELMVLATDPIAKIDIPLLCRKLGYPCEVSHDGDILRFNITRIG